MYSAANRISPFLLLLLMAAGGAVAAVALPLPLLLLALLGSICILLIPLTPLTMLVILLMLSPLRSLIATEWDGALPLPIGQLLLLLYLGLWLADRIRQGKPILVWRWNPVFISIVGLSAVLAIGAWAGESLGEWLNEWLKWIIMAVLVWQLTISDGVIWRWLIFAVIISAAGNALIGLYIFFGGSGADHLLILGRFFRAFGTFGQPNPFGGFMGIALPLGLMGALAQGLAIVNSCRAGRSVPPRHLVLLAYYGIGSILIAAALLASWSRGAWLATALALLVMLLASPKRLINGLIVAGACSALLAGLWFAGLLPNAIVNRLSTAAGDLITVSDVRGVNISPSNYAVIERLAHWQAAVNMAGDRPILGVGLGSYALVYDDYRLISWEDALGHAHNLYLNMLAEAGLVGLATYLAFWAAIFWLTWRARRHPNPWARACIIGLLGSWTYIAVHSLFDNLFVNNLFLHIGVLLSVLAILDRQLRCGLELE